MIKLERIIRTLRENKLTVSVAESCTGGYISYLLTRIPESSRTFRGGLVLYSLYAKNKFLNLPSTLLKKTDGVSSEVCKLLAQNVRKILKTDIGTSCVGFAGPGASKYIKPGTVFIAVSDQKGTVVKKVIIKGSRDTVRKKASQLLIELIYKRLADND